MFARKPLLDSKAFVASKLRLIPLNVELAFETMLSFKEASVDLKLLLSMILDFERLKAKLTIKVIWLLDKTSFSS